MLLLVPWQYGPKAAAVVEIVLEEVTLPLMTRLSICPKPPALPALKRYTLNFSVDVLGTVIGVVQVAVVVTPQPALLGLSSVLLATHVAPPSMLYAKRAFTGPDPDLLRPTLKSVTFSWYVLLAVTSASTAVRLSA
jgi:hypothetical protein